MHEGIISYAQRHKDIVLRLLEFSDIDSPTMLAKCDGYIARILNDEMADSLLRTGKPIIDVYCGQNRNGIISVDENRRLVGILAARHFLEHRFNNFAFCGLDGVAFSDGRRDAFVECLRLHRFKCNLYHTPQSVLRNFEKAILRVDRIDFPPDKRALSTWLKKLPKPIAVFCAHDSRAYQLIQVCHLCGLRVPDDVAILGVDDDELTCNYTTPTLSSINHNGHGIGQAAIRLMHELLRGKEDIPQSIVIKPVGLTTRESSNIYPMNPAWLSDALLFIRRNINRNISAIDVYDAVKKSHTVVDRAFRKQLDTSVQKTIIKIRLDEASHLIKNSKIPFSQIMAMTGYATSQHFCHSIVKAFGMNPTTLRKTAQKQNG